MTRRRKIHLVALLCISPVIYLAGREAYKAYLIYQVFSMIEKKGLDFTVHREFTIGDGQPTFEYDRVTSALGFTFPSGTVVEQCDDTWGHLHSCFILPPGEINTILDRPEITRSDRQPDNEISIQWLKTNAIIPATSTAFSLTDPPATCYPTIAIFADAQSSRVWVDYGYCPPYESVPESQTATSQDPQ